MWTTTALPFLTAVFFFASATPGRTNKSNKTKAYLIGKTPTIWMHATHGSLLLSKYSISTKRAGPNGLDGSHFGP